MREEPLGDLGVAHTPTERLLAEVRCLYGDPDITGDDLWAYIYGVLHAPDWRERFEVEMKRSRLRFPLAADFAAFRDAGRELGEMHAVFDAAPLHQGPRLEREAGAEIRIPPQGMKWGDGKEGTDDLTALVICDGVRLVDIPPEAHDYKVAGLSPLQWVVKESVADSEAGEDPMRDPRWRDDPEELVSHLRRLVYIGCRTAEICEGLPPSLSEYKEE